MTDRTTTHWLCIGIPPKIPPCGAGGTYEQASSGGAAEKHAKDTNHGTITSLNADLLVRIREETQRTER